MLSTVFSRCRLGQLVAWLPWLLATTLGARAQAVPNPGENIQYLITFGAQADPAWGDDDFTQTFFFLVPQGQRQPVYLRVYDPDCGDQLDSQKGSYDTRTSFSIYGGPGAHSGAGARDPRPALKPQPVTGRLLQEKTFGGEAQYDEKYYTFGPLNPLEGELVEEFKGYVFKVIVRGLSGNDGNVYRFFFSTERAANNAVPGGNAFTYEYCFRLPPALRQATVHLYPFVNDKVVSMKQSNYDVDKSATLKVFSVSKNGHLGVVSGDKEWSSNVIPITDQERGLSLDFRLTSTTKTPNDMVFYVTDQYDTALPFFAVPIGGPPRYKYDVDMKIHR
ncbi:hypothetical protein [Hymenobacter bucti]|uniref:Uncharacterized protein n=1 Tax=Hymenobacter bucti TaxID=1844114 RepID=A0ABW4QR43_9BACT